MWRSREPSPVHLLFTQSRHKCSREPSENGDEQFVMRRINESILVVRSRFAFFLSSTINDLNVRFDSNSK